jgi:hypothetical protein
MKTIPLSDVLYEKAEETASYLGVSQNILLSMALEEFIEKHKGQMITEKINEVYEKIDQTEFDHYLNVGLETVRKITKNDSW